MRPQADIKSALPEIYLYISGINRLGDDELNVNIESLQTYHHLSSLRIIMNFDNFAIGIIVFSASIIS